MSVIVTVAAVGAVTVGSKLFAGLCLGAAASLGMKAAEALGTAEEEARRAGLRQDEVAQLRAEAARIEVSVATEAALEGVVAERAELSFEDERIRLVVRRDIRGKVTVSASALHGRAPVGREEVAARAERFLGLLQQQIAYQRVVQEMRHHGFSVAEEDRAEDGTVRVRIRRRPS